jgi:hypothetical protein
MRVCEHFSQRMTCPPSAAVRQRSIADITFNWSRLTCPAGREPPIVIKPQTGAGEMLTNRRLHHSFG